MQNIINKLDEIRRLAMPFMANYFKQKVLSELISDVEKELTQIENTLAIEIIAKKIGNINVEYAEDKSFSFIVIENKKQSACIVFDGTGNKLTGIQISEKVVDEKLIADFEI